MSDEAQFWQPLQSALDECRALAVLTGAGMSTESGIPDFRSETGVWRHPEWLDAMSDATLRRNPTQFWRLYREIFLTPQLLAAEPNAGHCALAQLSQSGRQVHIVTQNVDGLHQRSGSTSVLEVHGNAGWAYCPRCHSRYTVDFLLAHEVPRCIWETPKGTVCDTVLHPDVVLFGQPVRRLEDAERSIQAADLVLVLGTSLTVEPVASLPRLRGADAKLAIINLEPTELDGEADIVLHARIGDVLPAVVAALG